jgi:hypothetical protein
MMLLHVASIRSRACAMHSGHEGHRVDAGSARVLVGVAAAGGTNGEGDAIPQRFGNLLEN